MLFRKILLPATESVDCEGGGRREERGVAGQGWREASLAEQGVALESRDTAGLPLVSFGAMDQVGRGKERGRSQPRTRGIGRAQLEEESSSDPRGLAHGGPQEPVPTWSSSCLQVTSPTPWSLLCLPASALLPALGRGGDPAGPQSTSPPEEQRGGARRQPTHHSGGMRLKPLPIWRSSHASFPGARVPSRSRPASFSRPWATPSWLS